MAKTNVKALLTEKGEKIALIAAAVMMLLFSLLGVLQVADAPDPDKFIHEVDATASGVTATINGKVNPKDIGALPENLTIPIKQEKVVTKGGHNLLFDPIAPPDKGRINPLVMRVLEVQADFMWAKVLSYDIRETADGQKQIGVVAATGKDRIDTEKAGQFFKDQAIRFNSLQNFPVGGPQPKGGQPQAPIELGQRDEIEYVSFDPDKLKDKRFALTILPRRMVVIQASFPYKAQIEEIQRALRLNHPFDVFEVYKPEETPKFLGVLIQRQVLFPDGKVERPWADLDVYAHYRSTIYPRSVAANPEDVKTSYVSLPPWHRLAMPLPLLVNGGKYPDVRLPSLKETMKKQAALNKPPEPVKTLSQIEGGGDIFAPVGINAAATAGQPNAGNFVANNPMAATEKEEPTPETKFQEVMDNVLIRLIDDDIEPGRKYQYRVKVVMQNPNWQGPKDKKGVVAYPNKFKEVSKPSDVQVMMIGADIDDEAVIRARFGLKKDEDPVKNANKIPDEDLKKNFAARTEWTELNAAEAVSVPREDFLYGVDPAMEGRKPSIALKAGEGVLEFQRWLQFAQINNKFKEPVADWVVADVVAKRGTYLGGRQLVNLPIWNSKVNKYMLRTAEPEKGSKASRGVKMDPTRPGPQYVVVDVEGGMVTSRPATRSVTIDDETAAEILLVDENGALQVRSSFADRTDAGRIERERSWKTWIENTEKDTPAAGAVGVKKKDNFD